jgi:uncharacterized membrane protein HdeD (DUF308 family)
MARATGLGARVAEEAFASVVFDAVLSIVGVTLGVVMLVAGIRGLVDRNSFTYMLTVFLGAGLLAAGMVSAVPQVLQLPERRRWRKKQALIDAEVAAFATTLAGAEPFDITGRL